MKKFITKIIKYSLAFIFCSYAISLFIYSFDREEFITNYEDWRVVQKYKYIKENLFLYDTLFFGSSITYRGILPEYFDELNNKKTSSFNMGVGGTKFRRIHNFTEATLKDDLYVKTVFFELHSPIYEIKGGTTDFFKSNPVIYSTTPNSSLDELDFILKINLSKKNTSKEIAKIIRKLIYKYSGVGISKHLYLLLGIEKSPKDYAPISKTLVSASGAGFEDVDLGFVEEGAMNSRFDFYNNSRDKTMKRIQDEVSVYKNFSFDESTDKKDRTIDEVERLADSFLARGIDFYFVLHSLSPNPDHLLKMKEYLVRDGYKVIDIANPALYPELYEVQNVRDIRHLNKDGAIINTKNLFEEYQKYQ